MDKYRLSEVKSKNTESHRTVLNPEYLWILLPVCCSICKDENTSENEIRARLLQYWSTSEIQTVSMFNIYMDALSMHFKGAPV